MTARRHRYSLPHRNPLEVAESWGWILERHSSAKQLAAARAEFAELCIQRGWLRPKRSEPKEDRP